MAYIPVTTVPLGGTALTTLTANNVILGNGTSAPTFVAPGTNGNVLTSNGTTWTSAAAGGGFSLTQLATSTPTGVAAVDFTSISASYRDLLLVWSGLSTTGTDNIMVTGNCGGGLGSEACSAAGINGTTGTFSGVNGGVQMFNTSAMLAASTSKGWVHIPLYAQTGMKTYNYSASNTLNGTDAGCGSLSSSTGAWQGIRVYATNNFAAGTITLYGVS